MSALDLHHTTINADRSAEVRQQILKQRRLHTVGSYTRINTQTDLQLLIYNLTTNTP